MTVKVEINGFGRIGRQVLKAIDGGVHVEHFSGRFVITEEGPAFGPGHYF